MEDEAMAEQKTWSQWVVQVRLPQPVGETLVEVFPRDAAKSGMDREMAAAVRVSVAKNGRVVVGEERKKGALVAAFFELAEREAEAQTGTPETP
jgi:hypothetical protein